MSCGFNHVDVFSFYNPHDHRDVYECQNCGRVKSKDAGPRFEHTVVVACCGTPQTWTGSSPVAAFRVGNVIDCPAHGPTKIVSISTTQTKGKTVAKAPTSRAQASSPAAAGPGAELFASIAVGCVAGLILGWIPMLIFGGPYLIWVALLAAVLGVLVMLADQ